MSAQERERATGGPAWRYRRRTGSKRKGKVQRAHRHRKVHRLRVRVCWIGQKRQWGTSVQERKDLQRVERLAE